MNNCKALIELRTVYDVANQFFPGANICVLRDILWNYTGYPQFWVGDPETCLRRQLKEAKEGLKKGLFFDLKRGWVDPNKKNGDE